MSTLRYRPEVDGLRALAVLPVILFHLHPAWMPGGYIGVDVFFVISGYLITSILARQMESGTFSFRTFYARRIRRIIPALAAMVIVSVLAYLLWGYSLDINAAGVGGFAALLSYANFSQWLTAGNYWGTAAEQSPFLHTWSLSVEEQFYLLFPLVLFGAFRYLRAYVRGVVVAIVVGSFVLFLVGARLAPTLTFYFPFTRAWELGIGAFLALEMPRRRPAAAHNGWAVAGLVAVLGAYVLLDGSRGLSAWMAVPVVGSAMLIGFTQHEASWVRRGLSWKPLVYIGTLSYSLYLWHWPVLVLTRSLPGTLSLAPRLALASLVFVALSVVFHYAVERPLRGHPRGVPIALGMTLGGLVLTFWAGHATFSEPTGMYAPTVWNGQRYNVMPQADLGPAIARRMQGIVQPTDSVMPAPEAYKEEGVVRRYGGTDPQIVLLGDSHALMWAPIVDTIARQQHVSVAFFAADGLNPFFAIPIVKGQARSTYASADQLYAYNTARLRAIDTWRPRVVLVASRWLYRTNTDEVFPLLRYVSEHGGQVILIEQPPEIAVGDRNTPQYLSYLGLYGHDGPATYFPRSPLDQPPSPFERVVAGCTFCHVVRVRDLYEQGDRVKVIERSQVLYIDDDHLSYAGAQRAEDRLKRAIASALQQAPLERSSASPSASSPASPSASDVE